jgi:hypothetical protein
MCSENDCQLKILPNASSDISIIDKIKLVIVRLQAALRRRVKKVAKFGQRKYHKDLSIDHDSSIPKRKKNYIVKNSLKTGDMVQILTYDEIQKTFDENGRTQGLTFMPGMKKYCGSKKEVLKKVNYIFDERAWEMRKIKNVVILKDIICKGEDMFSREGCDRCCFFFWKENWLLKD